VKAYLSPYNWKVGYIHQLAHYMFAATCRAENTGAHTNTTESTWRHVKAYLSPYNRKVGYIYQLAHMFAATCRAEKVHPFTKFLHLVATKDWSLCPSPLHNSAPSDVLLVSGHLQLHLSPQVHSHAHGSSKPSVTGVISVFRDNKKPRIYLRHG